MPQDLTGLASSHFLSSLHSVTHKFLGEETTLAFPLALYLYAAARLVSITEMTEPQ